jgi:inner membrane protein
LSLWAKPYGSNEGNSTSVIISELLWVWLPGVVLMGLLWWKRRKKNAR